jgi:hypothetical protein
MTARSAIQPPAPTTQADGDVRPASSTVRREPEATDPSTSQLRPITPAEISREAYARYEQRGRLDGHDVEDWLAAEESLRLSSERE